MHIYVEFKATDVINLTNHMPSIDNIHISTTDITTTVILYYITIFIKPYTLVTWHVGYSTAVQK